MHPRESTELKCESFNSMKNEALISLKANHPHADELAMPAAFTRQGAGPTDNPPASSKVSPASSKVSPASSKVSPATISDAANAADTSTTTALAAATSTPAISTVASIDPIIATRFIATGFIDLAFRDKMRTRNEDHLLVGREGRKLRKLERTDTRHDTCPMRNGRGIPYSQTPEEIFKASLAPSSLAPSPLKRQACAND